MSRIARGQRTHTVIRIVLLACVAVIVVITFWPTPVDRPFHAELTRLLNVLHGAGLPGWLNYGFVEAASNMLMFVPLGALVALYVMLPLWWLSGVAGLTLSLCVEFAQQVFLPHRFASPSDLAMNTAGALLGGLIVLLARGGARARR